MSVPNFRPKPGEQIQFIRSDGVEFNLNNPPSRAVLNMTGWGRPPDERHTIAGPYQHGDTLVSYRLNPRTISMDIVCSYSSRSGWYTGRSQLIEQMGINNASPNAPEPGVLRWDYFENKIHKIRCLDCYLNRGLGFTPLSGWQQWSVMEGLEFVAENPVIYDPTEYSSTLDVGDFALGMIFPVIPPFVLGSYYATTTITYTGTWETAPEIVIKGPAADIFIENVATGRCIRFNYVVSVRETVTFTLIYDEWSVENNFGEDLAQYVLDSSDLAEFTLQPDPIVAGGSNQIIVYTSLVDTPTTVTFNYLNRYYGI